MKALLTPIIQQELAATLTRERARVTETLRSLAEAERALSESQAQEGSAIGSPADVASDLADQELDAGLSEAASLRLAAVDAALRRLADGRYGSCERCDNAIGADRLQALPWTATCIDCASRPMTPTTGARATPARDGR